MYPSQLVTGGVSAAVREAAAARRNERELDRFPYGREGSASDRVGIKASPGVSLAIPIFLLQTLSLRMGQSQGRGI